MATKRKRGLSKLAKAEQAARKARAQARNERNKRLSFEQGVEKGLQLARDARRD